MINVSTYTKVANSLLRVYQRYTKGIRFLLIMFLTLTVSANVWGATYNFSNIPTSGWKTNGGSQTINGKSWTYSSATYVGCSDKAKIQIGSKNNPQTSNWTIQIPISSFGANIKVTKVAITAYTTATTATYDISVNGSSVKSGNLTTSSATYSSNTLNATTGSIVVTLKGSSNSKAMYLSDIAVTYETAAAATYKVTYNANGATSGTVPTDATSYTSGTTVTVKSNSGNLAKTGYTFGGWNTKSDGTGTNYTAGSGTFTITANTTLYAKWNTATKYTVTLDAGSGTCAESVTEPNAGEGVTLPTPTLDCGDWKFAGWKTTSAVTTKTTTKPTLIPAGNYKPTANTTLYAVYERTETTSGGGGGNTSVTFTDEDSGGWTTTAGEQKGTKDGVSISTTNGIYSQNNDQLRVYKDATFTVSSENIITSIVFSSSNYDWSDTSDGNYSSKTWTGNTNSVTFTAGNGQVRITQLVVTVSAGGTITTTYYHSTPDCGTPTPTPTLNVDPATLTFEKTTTNTSTQKTFTLTGSNLTANASLQLSGINPGMFSLSSNSVTQSAGSINQTITVTYTPTATGSHNATLTISSTGAESKTVTLSGTGVAPAAKYTVTFNACSGTCGTESLAEESAGAGVTLPTANPPATCATDGWKFAGWWTEAVTETTTSPGELLTAGSNYKPTSDCTLYAVYSYTEAGGGDSDVTFNFSNIATANSWTNGTAYTTVTISPITINAIGGGNNGKYYTSNTSWRMYNGGSLQISTDIGKITSVSSNPSKTFTINDEGTATLSFSATTEFKSITVSYSSSTTTYNSNPVCVASYSITYNFAGGTGSHCSNTSIPQGDSYTICDEAPTREGHTFQGWSDGTSTYAAGATIIPSSDVTLTAKWKANTYTVTWNNNGDTDEVTYNHGDALVVPTAPASCDGVKEFVGWTTHSGYYHATTAPDDIFTTKTTPVTATATYYAVFATPPTTGGGGGGSETTTTLDFTAQGYANAAAISNLTVNGVTATFDKGSNSNAPKYYSTGTAIRAYGGNTITLSSTGTITNVTFTFSSGDDGNEITTNNGDGEWNEPTWTGNTTSNIVFTIGGASGHRRIKSIAVTCTSGGGSGSHSDYTTICQQVESIVVTNPKTDFILTEEFTIGEGTVTATLSGGGTADVTTLATFSGYNMNEVGTYTVTATYMGATATYNINVKPLDNAWVLTWNVSGKTNTGLGPRSVIKDSAIGTLPVPDVPAACAGKTFMGWTESNVVPSDGVGIEYIKPTTVPTTNTTYYAVFATVNNFCTQKPIDQITSGSKVVIVAVASLDAGGTTGKAISSRTAADGNNLASDDVFVLDEQINTPHSTCVWTLTRESGKYIFTQDGKYLNAIVDPDKTTSGFCKFNSTKDTWTISESSTNTYRMLSSNQNKYVEWFTATGVFKVFNVANTFGTFDMQFFVTANANGGADITDYTTGCAEYTITYYGFRGGYSTSSSSDGTIVLPVNSLHTVPDCGDVVKDHTNLGREFLNVWMTKPHGGHTFKPGDTFILTQDTTLYAQWKLETNSDLTTLPTDIEDLAGTDVYVYGGKTLNIQPGTTTINSLTLKGGIQTDGSYQMPSVWVPEGATLVRNSNKIYLDLVVNAKTWYPFAVPFETKNTSDIHYLRPDMREAATYGKHFDIKTYDGARRADVGEDKANNWVRLKRHTAEAPVSFKPGVGYIISAMAYPGTDTATIRIPMTVPNTWFANGEQAVVGTTERNTMTVTAHTGVAANEHLRHAGWNFVANPYLSYFTGGGIDATNGLSYINGELIINSGFSYGGEAVPYVTIPAYDFSCYTAHKLSDIKLSPEYSFFVQVRTSGTMDFTTTGRQQAPAALRSNMDNPRIETDIVISHNQQTADHTGLIIDDRYTTAYEIGADLEKMFGSAYNTTIYTLGNDVRLAYNALSHIEATIPIPLGFRAETDGEYTISLTNPEDILTVESIVLQDSYNNTTTNLLLNDYTFYTDRTQDDQRFVVYIVPHNNAPTDISTIIDNDTETRKVIHNHRLYIIHNGHVYDGVGQTIQ